MSVYMGEQGLLALQRTAVGTGANALATTLEAGDVTVSEKRFSADFPPSALINGDHIEIATQDGSNLQLVDGHDHPDGYWFCHVNDIGGIRLTTYFRRRCSTTGALQSAFTWVHGTSHSDWGVGVATECEWEVGSPCPPQV